MITVIAVFFAKETAGSSLEHDRVLDEALQKITTPADGSPAHHRSPGRPGAGDGMTAEARSEMPATNAPVPIPVLDLFRLNGRVAIVTGAARGLGKALAIALAEAGADIVAIDIGDLDEVAAQVRARGVRCATRTADLSGLTPETAAELISWSEDRTRRIAILVNNAGIIRRGPATETAASDWSAVLDLNLTTPFLLSPGLRPGRPRCGNPGQRHQHRLGQLVPGRLSRCRPTPPPSTASSE